jgi:hypothetical protein
MTLLEAVKAGIIRVRRKTWLDSSGYLKLGYSAQVGLYPTCYFYARGRQKSFGEPTPQVVNSDDYWEDDYEEYKGIRDKYDLPESVFANFVYLLTSGDGDTHGDEWRLHGIYSTKESAERAKAEYERERPRSDGTTYRLEANIEQWNVEQ